MLEAAFRALPVEEKGSLMEALAPIEQSLRITSHGGVLLRKLRFEHWRRHPESWQKSEQKERTTRDAFADILADEPLPLEAAPKAAAGGFGGGAANLGGDAGASFGGGGGGGGGAKRKDGRDSKRPFEREVPPPSFTKASPVGKSYPTAAAPPSKPPRRHNPAFAIPAKPAASAAAQAPPTAPAAGRQDDASIGALALGRAGSVAKGGKRARRDGGGGEDGDGGGDFYQKLQKKKQKKEGGDSDRAARLAALLTGGGGAGGGGKKRKFAMA